MAEKILVPDVGEAADVEVVEVLVAVGDDIAADASLVVLESDKASMEIPAPISGKILAIAVAEGDKVEEGSLLVEIEAAEGSAADKAESAQTESDASQQDMAQSGQSQSDAKHGDPAQAGRAQQDTVPAGSSVDVSTGVQATDRATDAESGSGAGLAETASAQSDADQLGSAPPHPSQSDRAQPGSAQQDPALSGASVHAGPAVRKQARKYGVSLAEVKGTGQKGRILKEDIQQYVKARLSGAAGDQAGLSGIPSVPVVDFSRFGEVEAVPLSRIRKASARNLHRSWLNVPHVTQFDEADITDLESFRLEQNQRLQGEGMKLTPLAFLVKAAVTALQKYPQFNSSLAGDGESLLHKKFWHLGIAVETPDGLVVPVLKDADKKGVIQLAQESAQLAAQAREGKLPLDALQGATFTISSLGGIGGTAFTPIVNAPEVAILGVSRSRVAPVWNGAEFTPRTLLPLSLSYDHRAIDGAEAARFTHYLAHVLSDLREIIL